MQTATVRVKKVILISIFTKSTISIPIKFTTFATQKNKPLTVTPETPELSIYRNASDTNELYPARSTIINPIKVGNPCKAGMNLDY